MIKKLESKVFWILMVSISTIVLGVIILFAILNYNNTINAATSMLDRFDNFFRMPNDERTQTNNDDNRMEIDLSETYTYMIENGKIVDSIGNKNEDIEQYVYKAYKQNKEKGIVGNYVYKVRTSKMKDERTTIILMEDESVVTRIKFIYIYAISGSIISIIIAYAISKKVSNMIVKPVKETMESQKRFISDASHELKTPLAVIEANADVLESNIGKSKWMEYIQSEIASMDKLINNLLFLAKVENVKELKEKENFDLTQEVKMTASMFESMAYERKVKIEDKIEENVSFNGNKENIKQVLSVLIENAIMHTKENGKIVVELNKEKGTTVLQVSNEGEEIPKEERKKIFERFYRVDKSRNRKEKRYGLGLAIAKSIVVEGYNGKIGVDCKDGVTTFKVTL